MKASPRAWPPRKANDNRGQHHGDVDTLTLADWPPGHRSRAIRIHQAYLRAARRAGARTGWIFTIGDVAKRDRWACAVCGQPVPQSWAPGELATAPAYTFTVPWADGGRYDKASARLAHYGCATPADPHLARALAHALTSTLDGRERAGRHDETCTQGHPLAGANLLKASDGRRRCRQCRNDRESAKTPAGAA